MSTYSGTVQVSGRCPGGGERARRLCLSNEIPSHCGPVHQKTQRDQCWTAGLQWVAVLVKTASMSKALVENSVLSVFYISYFLIAEGGVQTYLSVSNIWNKTEFYLDGVIYNISVHNQITVSEILIWSLYDAFGNAMCFYHPWRA